MSSSSDDEYPEPSSSDEDNDNPTVPNGRHFDLADVPSDVEADDPLEQRDIYDWLFLRQEGVGASGPTWDQTKVTTIRLSALADMFNNNQAAAAINLLRRRVNLVIDPELSPRSDDPMLMWDGSNHYLDFMLVVAESIGCHAFLPNTLADHTFTVTLDLRQHYRQFRAKFGKLGFDPTGSMMAIGTSSSSELWFGFCPVENLEDLTTANEAPLLSEKHGDTRLSARHFRMAVMFLAYALSGIAALSIHITHPYGTDDDMDKWSISDATNIYSQRTWQLRLEDLLKLNERIISSWEPWVRRAPRSWKEDGWLSQHHPLSVSCRYGQNQPIASADPETRHVECANWQAERKYTDIRYVSLAIATDINVTQVRRWLHIPNYQILLDHNVVYDSPDPDTRQEVDLDQLPHEEPDSNEENNVYDLKGRRIPRRMGKSRPGTKPCGILVNLETVTELFSSFIQAPDDLEIDADVYDDDEARTPLVNVYPQAFLRKTGHIQCNAVLPHFGPFISQIHKTVTRRRRGIYDDELMDDDDDDLFNSDDGPVPPAVLPIACQFYNELSHRTRPSAALHDVQLGRITSAFSGAYATGRRAVNDYHKIKQECKTSLPHQRFNNKIELDDVPRDLRLENVYIIQLGSLKPNKRNGLNIYEDIVIPLARAWSHPNIFDDLRPHLVIFTPEAFPYIYQWTSFGVTSLLERIWERQLPLLIPGHKPAPEMIELCSVLERTLAYAHTGNAKVIATSLMRPFWLVQSLLQQGLPTLAPMVRVSSSQGTPIAVSPADWPTLTDMRVPAIASKRSHVLTYGQANFEAYKAEFHITLSINQLSPTLFQSRAPPLRHASAIALVSLQVYIADVKALVAAAVNKECNNEEGDFGIANLSNSKTRLASLRKWLSCSHPLSYQNRAFEHLLRCIVPNIEDQSDGLPNPSEQQLTIRDFSLRIINMTRPINPSAVAAPLISSAPSTIVLRIAATHMLKHAPKNSPKAADSFMQDAFSGAANHLEINYVPWHVANTGDRGRRARKPVHNSWVNLGRPSELQPVGQRNTRTINGAAEASNKAQASDARAPWAVQSITLQSLPAFISRDRLPDEFSIDHIDIEASETEPLIKEIYEWVFENFDIHKPIHKIALIAGIYISKILPDVFSDPNDKVTTEDSGPAITKVIRALPWKPTASSRKGCRSESQFIAMVPAYIIAVYEPTSPLRRYFNKPNKKSFPTRWNKKNSNKGIGSLNLIRLGLANARTNRIWKGGIFNQDWVLLTVEELAAKYHEINSCLSDLQYGPFKIAVAFFGLDKAVELGRESQTFTINPAMRSIASHRRHREIVKDDNDEVEIVEVAVRGKHIT